VVEPELKHDARGFFSRTYCSREFQEQHLSFEIAQCNITYTDRPGVLRGLHYQIPPATEHKIVRCTRGSVYYAVVDLRRESPTYLRHFSIELNDINRRILYVGPGFASGCQALSSGVELTYQMSEAYCAGRESGFRYDDPAFGIEWPLPVTAVSEKDSSWPCFEGILAGAATLG
jgi:dTDP-4-dehydrorhamnose 3,5-epimerase